MISPIRFRPVRRRSRRDWKASTSESLTRRWRLFGRWFEGMSPLSSNRTTNGRDSPSSSATSAGVSSVSDGKIVTACPSPSSPMEARRMLTSPGESGTAVPSSSSSEKPWARCAHDNVPASASLRGDVDARRGGGLPDRRRHPWEQRDDSAPALRRPNQHRQTASDLSARVLVTPLVERSMSTFETIVLLPRESLGMRPTTARHTSPSSSALFVGIEEAANALGISRSLSVIVVVAGGEDHHESLSPEVSNGRWCRTEQLWSEQCVFHGLELHQRNWCIDSLSSMKPKRNFVCAVLLAGLPFSLACSSSTGTWPVDTGSIGTTNPQTAAVAQHDVVSGDAELQTVVSAWPANQAYQFGGYLVSGALAVVDGCLVLAVSGLNTPVAVPSTLRVTRHDSSLTFAPNVASPLLSTIKLGAPAKFGVMSKAPTADVGGAQLVAEIPAACRRPGSLLYWSGWAES
jgi:hypothetical protein